MTYGELLDQLQTLNEEQLNQTVTVYDSYTDDYTAVIDTDHANEEFCDALDPEHLYLILKA